jgi:hypothetical protein
MQDHARTAAADAGIVELARSLWRAEGILPFYRGLLPSIIRVTPATCVTFVVYEVRQGNLQFITHICFVICSELPVNQIRIYPVSD